MNVLFDTNVVLDVLFARQPHVDLAERVFGLAGAGRLTGWLCATTLTTVYYLGAKRVGAERACQELRTLTRLFQIAPVDSGVLRVALDAGWRDFEDAVLHEAALAVGVQAIVTRNLPDFREARLPVWTPEQLLLTLAGDRT